MNTESKDAEVENYLKGGSDLSALYAKSKDLTSPEHLNLAIEQLARESLEADAGRHSPGATWKWPLALAATVILTVLVSIFYRSQNSTDAGRQLATRDISTQPAELPTPIKSDHSKHQPTPQQKPAEPVAPKAAPRDKQTPPRETIAQQQEEDLPPKLQELLQTTGSGDTAMTALLPDNVLKTWTRKQWREHVNRLKANHRDKLAAQYIKAYPRFFPGETLQEGHPAK